MEITEVEPLPIKMRERWYDAESPEVSIIVVNFNKSELTADCLRHIWAHTRGKRYEIIVVDNGSNAVEFRKIAELHGDFRLVRIPVNRYFGEGSNIGVEEARGKYLVFLNNDALVTADWLAPLIDVLETQPRAGGVGPRFLYPDGRVQEAGAFIDDRGFTIQRGKYYAVDPVELNEIGIVDYCSAACFVTTRKIFDLISGFDASYEPAYYEDADLCFKIASLDLFIYYCPRSVITHMEHATVAAFTQGLGLENAGEINREKFLSRWGNYLATRASGGHASLPPPAPVRARHHSRAASTNPIAVFHTPYDLMPGGGERYLLTAASVLNRTHRVYIASEVRYSNYRLDYLARELSIDLPTAAMVARPDLGQLGSIDLFVHLGNDVYPSIPPQGRRNFHVCPSPWPGNNDAIADSWSNLKGYEAVIVCSNFARDVLRATLSPFEFDLTLETLPPPVGLDAFAAGHSRKQSSPRLILSMGDFCIRGPNKRHDVAIEAMKRLANSGINAELHLVGALHPRPEDLRYFWALRQQAHGLHVKFHANASSGAVCELLSRATIYWHATGYGVDPKINPERCDHFGISALEAMAAGCVPFVVSSGGPPEFVHEEETGFQYNTTDELVIKTQAILQDPARLTAISKRAIQQAHGFSDTVFRERWRNIARNGLSSGKLPLRGIP